MSKYAATTTVSSEASRNEIEKTLKRYGAEQFAYATSSEKAVIAFIKDGKQVRFDLPLPNRADYRLTPTGKLRVPASQEEAWSQASRQKWRALNIVVKAKLEAVESGIAVFEEEFMAYIVMPNGLTVSEMVLPEIQKAYEIQNYKPNFLLLEGNR